jgi:hypothetical protein
MTEWRGRAPRSGTAKPISLPSRPGPSRPCTARVAIESEALRLPASSPSTDLTVEGSTPYQMTR